MLSSGKPVLREIRISIVALSLLIVAFGSQAQNLDAIAPYQAGGGDHRQYGEIRTWGNENMLNVLRLWQLGFRKHQRAVHFADTLPSGAVAIGALYTGVADIALAGHRIWPIERLAFHRVFGYEPFEIRVASGSYDVPAYMPGNVIFLNERNPLSKLTLKQLDGIFGSQRTGGWRGMQWSKASARGAAENIRTWGQLGLTGEWKDKPIRVYGYDLTGTGFSISMQQKVFEGGDIWNPTLNEAPLGIPGVIGQKSALTGGDHIVDALSHDPLGIAYAQIQHGRKSPHVKPVALATAEGGPYVAPTKENFLNGTYPLIESIHVYINRVPGEPIDPKVKEFLRYILSREGQQAVAQAAGYLPLTAQAVSEELRKLD